MADADVHSRLELERRRVAERVAALSREFDAIVAASAEANIDDEHDPEGATVGFERAQVMALLEQAHAHRAELDRALAGTEHHDGRCRTCGAPIPSERLDALPTAVACVSCANAMSQRARR